MVIECSFYVVRDGEPFDFLGEIDLAWICPDLGHFGAEVTFFYTDHRDPEGTAIKLTPAERAEVQRQLEEQMRDDARDLAERLERDEAYAYETHFA